MAGDNDFQVGSWSEDRPCCNSQFNTWHGRPCTVNGPTGSPEEETKVYGPQTKVIVTDNLPPGPILVGEFTHDGTELVQALYGRQAGKIAAMEDIYEGDMDSLRARGLVAGYYRTCCSTAPGSPHWKGCGTNFFADGQTVIKPDFNARDPWGPARLRICEDNVASDRTFENETRPH
jgi:hypothetical protein